MIKARFSIAGKLGEESYWLGGLTSFACDVTAHSHTHRTWISAWTCMDIRMDLHRYPHGFAWIFAWNCMGIRMDLHGYSHAFA